MPRIGRRPSPMDQDYAERVREAQVFVWDDRGVRGVLVLVAASDHLLIENVAVDPLAQGRGIGRGLLEHAEHEAAALGLDELRLYTNAAMTENIALYARLGYREDGRRSDGWLRPRLLQQAARRVRVIAIAAAPQARAGARQSRHEEPSAGAGSRLRRPRARHDPVRVAGRRGRRDRHRQGRCLRLRLLEARRHVRPCDARGRAAAVQRVRRSPASACCARRSRRSTPRRGASRPTPAPTRRDVLVVALGADYDLAATPGLAESRRRVLLVRGRRAHERGRAGLLPRATSSSASAVRRSSARRRRASACCCCMTSSSRRGVRDDCTITLVLPFARPVPPSPETSAALEAAFAERDIRLITGRKVARARPRAPRRRDRRRQRAALRPLPRRAEAPRARRRGRERADRRTATCRSTPATLETRVPGVYAIGDVATQGTPKAGVFAEGAARALATSVIARLRGAGEDGVHAGTGSCYIEFGDGPHRPRRHRLPLLPVADRDVYQAPSVALRAEKQQFGSSRRARWFGRTS